MDELVTLLRIKQKSCTLSHGILPCTATGDKCYNTTATCQDRENYTAGTIDLWFSSERSNLPIFTFNGTPIYTIPSLASASVQPAKLNINSGRNDVKALGVRERMNAQLIDHAHNDNVVDPYQSVRAANNKATFWTKWLARNKYYQGTECELYIGKLGEPVEAMQSRLYIIEKIEYNGNSVSLTAKDVLSLADDNKAVYPKINTGKLVSQLAIDGTQITVTNMPEYFESAAQNGFLAIGDENIYYTSKSQVATNSTVIFGGLVRGQHGTAAKEHAVNAVVQLVAVATDVYAYDAAFTFLQGLGLDQFINLPEWVSDNQELQLYPVSYIIRKPAGVNELLGELTRDTDSFIYWSATEKKIKLKYILPLSDPVDITQDDDIIAGGLSAKVSDDRRVNEFWLYYNQKDNSKELKAAGNADVLVFVDTDAKSADEYGDRKISQIYSRFISNEAHALDTAERMMLRYRDAPITYSIQVRTKKQFALGDFIDLKHWQFVDANGDIKPKRCQITSIEYMTNGRADIEAESFEAFAGAYNVYMKDNAQEYAGGDTLVNSYYTDDNGLLQDGKKGAIYG